MNQPLETPYVVAVFCGETEDKSNMLFARRLGELGRDCAVRFKSRGDKGVVPAIVESGAECTVLLPPDDYQHRRYEENRPINASFFPRADEEDFQLALVVADAVVVFPGGVDAFRNAGAYFAQSLNGNGPRPVVLVGAQDQAQVGQAGSIGWLCGQLASAPQAWAPRISSDPSDSFDFLSGALAPWKREAPD
jgi:hypothetical protein